jgi:hypothetical protein
MPRLPSTLARLRFSGIQIGLVLFGAIWLAMHGGAPGTAPEVTPAFAVSLAVWTAFLIATGGYSTANRQTGPGVAVS